MPSLERVTAVLKFFHLGWMVLVVVLPLGSGQAGGSQIILLDRTPFYAPSTMTILPGQAVQWYNHSMQPHTVTHDGCGRGGQCAFASEHLHPGERFSVNSLPPGTYSYHCEIHPFMRGRIQVKRIVPNHSVTEL